VEKVNRKKQHIECNAIVFSKKVVCFYKCHVTFFKMNMKKQSKWKKMMYFFYVMAYVIKSGKSESEKATYWMQCHRFFKKSGVFLQISCKNFQNEHDICRNTPLFLKKRCTFFMLWLMLSKVKKVNRKKQNIECNTIVFSKKVVCFYKYHASFSKWPWKSNQNEKKRCPFLCYGLCYKKWKKGIGKSKIWNANAIVFQKSGLFYWQFLLTVVSKNCQ